MPSYHPSQTFRVNFTTNPAQRGTDRWRRLERARRLETIGDLLAAGWEGRHLTRERRHGFIIFETTALTAVVEDPLVPALSFGVELEFYTPERYMQAAIASTLTEAGIPTTVERYGHSTPTCWKIVTDGTLGDYDRGCELVSPILRGEEGLRALAIACRALKTARCRVSRRCGFHVHVGVTSRPIGFFKNLLRLYAGYEQVIDGCLPPSRRYNQYCYSGRRYVSRPDFEAAQTLDELRVANGGGYESARYRKLNLEAFWRHGTVEFRQHQGTLNAGKAVTWTRFCLGLVRAAEMGKAVDPEPELSKLMDCVEATAALRRGFETRYAAFSRVA